MAPATTTFTIRLDEETRLDLDELAESRGVPLTALMREQIDVLLGRNVDMRGRDADVPRSLSLVQRSLLARQHEALSVLYRGVPDQEHTVEYHREVMEILNSGYAGEYHRVFGGVDREELSRTDSEHLWNLLDMFRMLGACLERFTVPERLALGDDERFLKFRGFDVADELEGRFLYYTRYLIRTDRWRELAERIEEIGDDGNSHARLLPSYERMFAVYQPKYRELVKNGWPFEGSLLSIEDLKDIAAAVRLE